MNTLIKNYRRPFTSKTQTINEDVKQFKAVWTALFSSNSHLDSILSKVSEKRKPMLARIIPEILRRPIAYANALGIGTLKGEPWNLTGDALVNWKPAEQIFKALVENGEILDEVKSGGIHDFPPEMVKENDDKEIWKALTYSPPLTIRVKKTTDRELVGKELNLNLTKLSPVGLTSPNFSRILHSDYFKNGSFEIQDEGSQLMSLFSLAEDLIGPYLQKTPSSIESFYDKSIKVTLPEIKPLQFIDTCAGAGGKTLAISDLMSGKGKVFAYDIYDGKLIALKKRAIRANVQNIKTKVVTDDVDLSSFEKTTDRILIDAPCSGWGVLRRNPDLKWKWNPEKENDLPALQLKLLNRYSPLLKIGGVLTFGVCTFRKAETLEIVDQFLKENQNFRCKWKGYLGPHPMDGFFMASFLRES